jgi:hypothetical protein
VVVEPTAEANESESLALCNLITGTDVRHYSPSKAARNLYCGHRTDIRRPFNYNSLVSLTVLAEGRNVTTWVVGNGNHPASERCTIDMDIQR